MKRENDTATEIGGSMAAALGDGAEVSGYGYARGGVTAFTRKVIGGSRLAPGVARALGGPDTKITLGGPDTKIK